MSNKEAPRPGLLRAAQDGKITNREGAVALGMSVRQFRRLRRRFESEGTAGLVHRSRGRRSPKRISEALRRRVARLLQGRYVGFNDCHVTEMLVEHEGLVISRALVQRLRTELGLRAKHRRRPPQHRRRRERASQCGALVLVDASEHRWCENRAPAFSLVGAVDDATGAILALVARPHEDLHGYAVLLRELIRTHGLPSVLYGDRTSIFVRNDRGWSLEEELAGEREPTQGGAMLRALGIGYIPAQSPQAKGRIERFWGTLQDRLVSVLRLGAAASLQEADACLPAFIQDYNRRFTHAPQDPKPAWRPIPRNLESCLACHYSRVVAKDNTVALPDRWIQIPRGLKKRSYAGCRVTITELLGGSLLVHYQDRLIAQENPPPGVFTLRSRKGRRCITPRRRSPAKPSTSRPTPPAIPPHPGPKHPWRHLYPSTPAAVADRDKIAEQ
jgi:transposase